MTAVEAAKMLRTSKRAVYALIAKGFAQRVRAPHRAPRVAHRALLLAAIEAQRPQ